MKKIQSINFRSSEDSNNGSNDSSNNGSNNGSNSGSNKKPKPNNNHTVSEFPRKYYCYRHRPDLQKARVTNEPTMEELLKRTESLPQDEKEKVQAIWSLFEAISAENRLITLQGIVSKCCLNQLAFLSDNLKNIIRIDFITVLPQEIAFHILSYLDAISLCHAAQVSKHWNRLSDDDVVWHKLCEQHIDKKCPKCGWGLPSLLRRRRRTSTNSPVLATCGPTLNFQRNSRPPSTPSSASNTAPSTPSTSGYDSHDEIRTSQNISQSLHQNQYLRPWKEIYSERLVLERNWRKGRYQVRVLRGHTDGVMCCQYDDCNNQLVTGSYDKTVRVWDLETGECIRVLVGHTRCVRALQFDDSKLITGSMDNTLKIWNRHTGRCIKTLACHTDGVICLHFDDHILVSGSADCTIKVWNFNTCECYTLTGHQEWVNQVVIFQKTQLFSCSDDFKIKTWDLNSRTCTRTLVGHNAQVQCIQPAFSLLFPNLNLKRRSGSGVGGDGGGDVRKLSCTRNLSESIDCNRESSHPVIISGSLDNIIKIWSIETGECLKTLFGHEDGIWSLAVDKLRLVSGAHDNTVKIWDKDCSGECMHTLYGHRGAVNCVALSDTKIISGSNDTEIRIWDFKYQQDI